MASALSIANDLVAWANLMDKRGFDIVAARASLRRGAETIRELQHRNDDLTGMLNSKRGNDGHPIASASGTPRAARPQR